MRIKSYLVAILVIILLFWAWSFYLNYQKNKVFNENYLSEKTLKSLYECKQILNFNSEELWKNPYFNIKSFEKAKSDCLLAYDFEKNFLNLGKIDEKVNSCIFNSLKNLAINFFDPENNFQTEINFEIWNKQSLEKIKNLLIQNLKIWNITLTEQNIYFKDNIFSIFVDLEGQTEYKISYFWEELKTIKTPEKKFFWLKISSENLFFDDKNLPTFELNILNWEKEVFKAKICKLSEKEFLSFSKKSKNCQEKEIKLLEKNFNFNEFLTENNWLFSVFVEDWEAKFFIKNNWYFSILSWEKITFFASDLDWKPLENLEIKVFYWENEFNFDWKTNQDWVFITSEKNFLIWDAIFKASNENFTIYWKIGYKENISFENHCEGFCFASEKNFVLWSETFKITWIAEQNWTKEENNKNIFIVYRIVWSEKFLENIFFINDKNFNINENKLEIDYIFNKKWLYNFVYWKLDIWLISEYFWIEEEKITTQKIQEIFDKFENQWLEKLSFDKENEVCIWKETENCQKKIEILSSEILLENIILKEKSNNFYVFSYPEILENWESFVIPEKNFYLKDWTQKAKILLNNIPKNTKILFSFNWKIEFIQTEKDFFIKEIEITNDLPSENTVFISYLWKNFYGKVFLEQTEEEKRKQYLSSFNTYFVLNKNNPQENYLEVPKNYEDVKVKVTFSNSIDSKKISWYWVFGFSIWRHSERWYKEISKYKPTQEFIYNLSNILKWETLHYKMIANTKDNIYVTINFE